MDEQHGRGGDAAADVALAIIRLGLCVRGQDGGELRGFGRTVRHKESCPIRMAGDRV